VHRRLLAKRCRHADNRRQEIAAENIGWLRQRTRRLTEDQHGRSAERRQQQRHVCQRRETTDRSDADNRAKPRLGMRKNLPGRLMARGEGADMAAHCGIPALDHRLENRFWFSRLSACTKSRSH